MPKGLRSDRTTISTRNIGVRMPDGLYKQIEKIAEENTLTVSRVIKNILEWGCNQAK